jgi:hypothetical protein
MSPHIAALAGYLLLALVVYAPVWFSGALLVSGDSLSYAWPQRLWFATFSQQGWQGWQPNQFLGLPFLGTSETALLYPPHAVFLILPPDLAHNLLMAFHLVMAGFGTRLLLRAQGVSEGPAFLGGLVYGCSGAMMAHRPHLAIYSTAAWLPLVAFTQERWLRTGRLHWAGLGALAIGCQALAGSFQIFLYSGIAVGVAVLGASAATRRPGIILRSALPYALGVVLALPQILASHQLAQEAWRIGADYDFFREYCMTLPMLPILVAPFLFGHTYGGPYWGEWNLNELACFVGTLPLVVALGFAVERWRTDARARIAGLVALVALVLALGDSLPTYRLLYHVPVYNFFRVSARHLLVFDFALALLFALGLDHLLEERRGWSTVGRRLLMLAGALLGSAILVKALLSSTMAPELLSPVGRTRFSESFSRHNPAYVLPLMFLLGGTILTVVVSRLRAAWVVHVLLGTLILAELASFFLPMDAPWPTRAEVDSSIHNGLTTRLRELAGYERTLSPSDDTSVNVAVGFNRLNAVQSLNPRKLFDLLNSRPMDFSSRVKNWDALLETNLTLSLLNVRYITAESGSPEAEFLRRARLQRPGPLASVDPSQPLPLASSRTFLLTFRTRSSLPDGFTLFTPSSLEDGVHAVSLAGPAGPERTVTQLLRSPAQAPASLRLEFSGGEVRDVRWGALQPASEAPLYDFIEARDGTEIFRNSAALPRAFCVTETRPVSSFDDVKRALLLGEVDPLRTALLLRATQPGSYTPGKAQILSFEPDRVRITVSSQGGTFLVLADQSAPGWSATIQGRRVPLLEPFGLLRGLEVPAGTHEVLFEYQGPWVRLGVPAAALAMLAVVGLLATGCVRPQAGLAAEEHES